MYTNSPQLHRNLQNMTIRLKRFFLEIYDTQIKKLEDSYLTFENFLSHGTYQPSGNTSIIWFQKSRIYDKSIEITYQQAAYGQRTSKPIAWDLHIIVFVHLSIEKNSHCFNKLQRYIFLCLSIPWEDKHFGLKDLQTLKNIQKKGEPFSIQRRILQQSQSRWWRQQGLLTA